MLDQRLYAIPLHKRRNTFLMLAKLKKESMTNTCNYVCFCICFEMATVIGSQIMFQTREILAPDAGGS